MNFNARKGPLAKGNEVTLISLWSQRKATSADIRVNFAHFAWFGEP